MLNIYYCPNCGKFHFADEIGIAETYKKCSHCFSDLAINTQKSKAEYDAMDEVSKNEFKSSIKERFTLSNVKREIENLEAKKKEENWSAKQEATGIRYEYSQSDKSKMSGITTTITNKFYDDRIVQIISQSDVPEMPNQTVAFIKDICLLKLRAVDLLKEIQIEFWFSEGDGKMNLLTKYEFEYNGKMYQTNHYTVMKEIYDFLVNQIAKFKQLPKM